MDFYIYPIQQGMCRLLVFLLGDEDFDNQFSDPCPIDLKQKNTKVNNFVLVPFIIVRKHCISL